MIVYARSLDANARAMHKRFDETVDAPLTAAQAKLADARFAAYRRHALSRRDLHACASATARSPAGRSAASWSRRAPRWAARSSARPAPSRSTCRRPSSPTGARIDPKVAYDFVTTNDIIGGNSGSPVIDRAGAVIGAAFDGNIHSLGGNYGYDGTINRTVAVSTAAVDEALRKIYPAPNLVAELDAGR